MTHNAKKHLVHCLPPLINSPLNPRVVVVNSSSGDGTVEEAKRLGAETLVVPRETFNHGMTREKARKYLNADVVVMVTPDAYALNFELIERLTAPILDGKVSVAYARQLPHRGAGVFEAFSRTFNYPESSQIRSIEDVKQLGPYTFFCSNSCCAWKNAALDEIGGFQHVLLGEDTLAAAMLLHKGHKMAYVADACVYHSHAYSLWQEFQRHYDAGLSRRQYGELLFSERGDAKRGRDYTKSLLSHLLGRHKKMIPYAVLQTLFKWCGYQLGRATMNCPEKIKKVFSSQDFYWN